MGQSAGFLILPIILCSSYNDSPSCGVSDNSDNFDTNQLYSALQNCFLVGAAFALVSLLAMAFMRVIDKKHDNNVDCSDFRFDRTFHVRG